MSVRVGFGGVSREVGRVLRLVFGHYHGLFARHQPRVSNAFGSDCRSHLHIVRSRVYDCQTTEANAKPVDWCGGRGSVLFGTGAVPQSFGSTLGGFGRCLASLQVP